MKKLITLILVLTGMVSTASADDLTTVYLKPGLNWSTDSPRYALYMYDTTGQEDPSWADFTLISSGLYYAYFNQKYDKMIICRMNPGVSTNHFDYKYNQTANLNAPSASTPVYTVGESTWDNETPTPVSIDASGCTIHKIYVQDKENSGQTPCFYEYQNETWNSIDNAWPGTTLTTETVEDATWYVFKTLKTSVLGRFMQQWNNGSNFAAGGVEYDLSSGNLFYNYYPSCYQSVLTSEALSTPAIMHFRSNNGSSTLRHYFWNNGGINDEGFTTTSAGGKADWVTIKTYKPGFSIQFYTYDNGGSDTDKSDGLVLSGLTGGENYYYFAKLNANNATGVYQHDGKGIMKKQGSYYLVYADGWDFDTSKETWSGSGVNQTVGAIELTENAGNEFLFEGTLDNTSGGAVYYAIVPASDWNGTSITEWQNLISPSHPACSDNMHTTNAFILDECDAMPTTWTRWKNDNFREKIKISFDFAAMKLTIAPYRTATIGAAEYMTYSNGEKCTVSGAEKIYVVTANNTNSVHLDEKESSTVWPANEGMILKGSENDIITIKAVASDATASTIGTNYLVGSGNSTAAVTAGEGVYIFKWDGEKASSVGFYKAVDGTLGAHKAYLNLGRVSFNARDFLGFDFDGETTGISRVENIKLNAGNYYNLAGQRVAQPQKGLYIVNGKKVIIK